MDKPKISVLMGVYNEKVSWIRESVESILNQTYENFEFIIIDDNPVNNELKSYLHNLKKKDERIVIIFNDCNLGLTKSLNKGLAIAKGEYIARMDADDISFNSRFEEQVLYLEKHQDCDAVYGFWYNFEEENRNQLTLRKAGPKHRQIIDKLFVYNTLPHPLVMLRKSTLNKWELKYDEEFVHAQDYDLWLMMAIKGCKFYVIPKPLLYYRKSKNQITRSKSESQTNFKNKAKQKFLKKYFLDAGFEDQTIISNTFLESLYRAIVSRRKWNEADKQIFAMLYVTLNEKPLYFLNILYKSIFLYHFTVEQLVLIFVSCFRTVNTFQLKNILSELNIHVSN